MNKFSLTFSSMFLLLATFNAAQAGIIVDRTRVIFQAEKNEVTLGMTNNAVEPHLVQVWIDDGKPSKEENHSTMPFIATPPIFRIDPGKGQSIRIVLLDQRKLPQDRESVYWLNLLEVQPKLDRKKSGDSGYIRFPVKTRLKIFYRPPNLPGSQEAAANGLRWRLVSEGDSFGIQCENPSSYNVSFIDLNSTGKPSIKEIVQSGMCPAKGNVIFPIAGGGKEYLSDIKFSSINDYGGFDSRKAVLIR